MQTSEMNTSRIVSPEHEHQPSEVISLFKCPMTETCWLPVTNCRQLIIPVLTPGHEDVDSGLLGVAGVAGVVALVPWPGGRDGEETLRPVLVPPHTDGPGGVVVDHLLVLVPEDVPRLNTSHQTPDKHDTY